MSLVLKENDVVAFENDDRYLVVKTLEYLGQFYHYIIKLKEDMENPEIVFVYENIINGELDLVAVTDKDLIENLVRLLRQ